MAKAKPYLKYEPTLGSLEDARFEFERVIRAINRLASDVGVVRQGGSSSGSAPQSTQGSLLPELLAYFRSDGAKPAEGDWDLAGHSINNVGEVHANAMFVSGQEVADIDLVKRYNSFMWSG